MNRKLLMTLKLAAALPATAGELRAVVPVVGSTRGAFGSNFKTELQLNNRSAQRMQGTLVLHPQDGGAPLSLSYDLAPHATLHWADVMESYETSGLGSLDIVTDAKGVPAAIARAFDDRGDDGTTGTTVPAIAVDEVLHAGTSATLILPADRQRFRYNVGVRTFGEGATVLVSIYGENGVLRKSLDPRSWSADVFTQTSADDFAGEPLLANESLVFKVTAGAAVIYGTTTDNITNDPSITIAH
jgi:hypothetical protein